MDDRRFDALTRALAHGTSRRTALKGLLGGVIGGAALVTRLDRAGAQTPCQNDSDCDAPCEWCVGTTCETYCDDGEQCCNGTCYTPGPGVCCIDSECPASPSACTVVDCYDFACRYTSTCDGGRCCGDVCVPQCCSDEDCDPVFEDQCGITFCNAQGHCDAVTECLQGQRCCNSGTPQHYCGYCCSDTDCPGCQVCTDEGTCEQPECCGDSDCVSVCGECVEGACVTRCTTDEYCCAFANDCRAPGECCTDDECPCGGACSDGTCYPQPPCPEGQECCGDVCSPVGTCCQGIGATCEGGCCPDLQCCGFNGGSYCGECCADSECSDPCEICVEGECVGACSQSQECCDDECVAIGTC